MNEKSLINRSLPAVEMTSKGDPETTDASGPDDAGRKTNFKNRQAELVSASQKKSIDYQSE